MRQSSYAAHQVDTEELAAARVAREQGWSMHAGVGSHIPGMDCAICNPPKAEQRARTDVALASLDQLDGSARSCDVYADSADGRAAAFMAAQEAAFKA